jgi:DSF synthase
VDRVVDDGEGEQAVGEFIREHRRNRNGLTGMARAKRRVSTIDFDELMDVVHIWVDTALGLSQRDLKLMQRLVARQSELGAEQRVH